MIIDRTNKQVHFTRRSILKGAGATAGALAVGSLLTGAATSLLDPIAAQVDQTLS